MDIIVNLNHRSESTASKAGHAAEIESLVRRCLSKSDTQVPTNGVRKELPAVNMAGCAHTNFDSVLSGFSETVFGIERGNSKNLIFREFQEPGSLLDCFLGDITQLLLNSEENRNQVSLFAFESGEYLVVVFVCHGGIFSLNLECFQLFFTFPFL